ncbi:kelch repeat and BTB domain-containing protein 12 isoform X1 [Lepisosteus oculatus]|nr:PREDICTED: kelch repeat and BTB domain-containing protein 12 isoform X2 [Lepisosteus oculatus]XP_015203418.1 PREDICTED: kelch repeat and BTB domain-containing protein 12 isoform X2 [Lepisosteus oculatus]XP_015203419.1 PREDICTED: kelch repeat and BTB domain-containing protein 12 isoform X2 [Lepisosteus oculatus]
MDCRVKHSLALLGHINKMKEMHELTDVVLVAEGVSFPCHRLVLSAFSPYFKVMFTCGLQECSKREVILQDATPDSLSVILSYMYSSELLLSNANVQSVSTAAFLLQMDDVFKNCQKYMVDHMDASNCVGVYHYAKLLGAEDLAERAKKYLYQHFAEVCLHEEILEVDSHQLLALISSDDLNVSREESVLDVVLRWVNYDRNPRAEHALELLKQVRLVLVSPDFLREALKRNTALLCNSQCYSMITEALEFAQKAGLPRSLHLRYGMETTDLLLCIGNNGLGIKSRHGSYADFSFCYAPTTKRTYFMNSPRYGEALGSVCAGVVMENNDVVVAGEAGALRLSRQKSRNVEICRYHIKSRGCWEKLCSAEYREMYALGTLETNLYLLGGQMKLKNQYVVTNCVQKFSMEGTQWRSSPPLPIPLACHAAVTLKNKLYVLGGWTPQTDRPDDEPDRLSHRLFEFDPVKDKWTERASMTYSKYRCSTAAVNGEIYVLGGIGCLGADHGQARRCLDNVEIYNPDGDFWREGPPLPSPLLSLRTNATNAGVVEGKLYVCGAYNGADRHEVITKDILELDPWDNQWNVVAHGVLMHDSYDVCLVAKLNPRDLIPPPTDLLEQ